MAQIFVAFSEKLNFTKLVFDKVVGIVRKKPRNVGTSKSAHFSSLRDLPVPRVSYYTKLRYFK